MLALQHLGVALVMGRFPCNPMHRRNAHGEPKVQTLALAPSQLPPPRWTRRGAVSGTAIRVCRRHVSRESQGETKVWLMATVGLRLLDFAVAVSILQSCREVLQGSRMPSGRAILACGRFKICPLKCRNGRPRTQVQHLMQIDLKGWFLNYSTFFQYHSLLQILNCVAGTEILFFL